MKIIYYRRAITFCKYPFSQEVDTDVIEFSLSKKKFDNSKLNFSCLPSLSMKERTMLCSEKLGTKKIVLEKA